MGHKEWPGHRLPQWSPLSGPGKPHQGCFPSLRLYNLHPIHNYMKPPKCRLGQLLQGHIAKGSSYTKKSSDGQLGWKAPWGECILHVMRRNHLSSRLLRQEWKLPITAQMVTTGERKGLDSDVVPLGTDTVTRQELLGSQG